MKMVFHNKELQNMYVIKQQQSCQVRRDLTIPIVLVYFYIWLNMSIKIAILEDGGEEEFADLHDCFEKLSDYLSVHEVLMNTMKCFLEELINKVLQLMTNSQKSIPLFFRDLNPVVLLHNVGDYFYIVQLVNKLNPDTNRLFNDGKQRLSTETGIKDVHFTMQTNYFSCARHCDYQICPISGNSTFLNNCLCYLATCVRLAGLAYISGIIIAPKWFTIEIASTLTVLHDRLVSVGGWEELKRICENFEANPRSVEDIKFVKCSTIKVDH